MFPYSVPTQLRLSSGRRDRNKWQKGEAISALIRRQVTDRYVLRSGSVQRSVENFTITNASLITARRVLDEETVTTRTGCVDYTIDFIARILVLALRISVNAAH